MGLAGSDDILDDMLPFGSTKTEQNVGKFAPKPGGKFKKPLSKKAKPSNVPNAVEVALGKDANIATSDLAAKTTELGDLTSVVDADFMKLTPVEDTSKLIGETKVSSGQSSETISNATIKPPDSEHSSAEYSIQAVREPLVLAESSHVSEENEEVSAGFESSEVEADPLCHSSTVARKCDVYQSGSQCSESETSLPCDSGNILQDLDLMAMSVSPCNLTVEQRDKYQPKSALCLKGPKNKSVSFSLPVETEMLPSHKQGLDFLDLNVALEPVEGNLSNKEDSLANTATEHADFPDNDEEFEYIDEFMNIDSWDEPSIPTKLENDGAKRTSGGSSKRSSTGRAFENDIHTNIDSEDMEDLNESNDDDILTTNDMNGTKKTTKSKGNSSKKSDPKKLPDNDEEFESIDEIMNMDSWDEPIIPTKPENGGTDKTSRGLRKRNSTSAFESDDHTKYDSGGMGDLNESNDNDDDWTTNDMNDNKKTTKKKRKSSKESYPIKIPDNDEEFESIDGIMNFDSWDEPSIPTLENSGTDKTSGGSRKRYSTRRTSGNGNHTNNDGGDMGNLKKLNDDDDDWTANDTNDIQKTTNRKRKSSKESNSKEPKKKIPHGTRRKRRQVEKPLLEKVEHGIDPTQLPIRDLILIAEAKERILSKEAAVSMPNSNNDSHADHDNPLDEGFDPDSEEAHRHRLKHARKVNYHTHMNISRSPRWSKEDTELFFEAVRNFKTSFEMMVWLFPGRTPRQLKAKFKAEERKHPLELHDALDFRSKDHTLFSKVIHIMKEQKKAEDDAANEVEEEIGQLEKEENAGTASNHKADNSDKTDPWNDCDFDFNEPANLDLELDADVSFTQNREEKVDSEKEKQMAYNCEDDAKNSEEKDLWDDDFDMLEFNDCEDLELETDFASTQFEEKK